MTRESAGKMVGRVAALAFALIVICFVLPGRAEEANWGNIRGQVGSPGIKGAAVWLFDAQSGSPIAAQTLRPLFPDTFKNSKTNLYPHYVLTDAQGHFSFTNLPPGDYRLIAETWVGDESSLTGKAFPPDGKRPNAIELYGTAENIAVPSQQAEQVQINPLGKGTLDLTFRHGSLIMVTTKPLAADPVLGPLSFDENFARHLIGIGIPPDNYGDGRYRITGLPETNIHVTIFVNDNSPGVGTADFPVLPKTPQEIRIVAGWSDGYKVPPARIQHIMDVLGTNHVKWVEVVKPKRMARPETSSSILLAEKESLGPLDRVVELPNGEKATVGDVFAADLYMQLRNSERKR